MEAEEVADKDHLKTIKKIVKFVYSENLASKPGNILI